MNLIKFAALDFLVSVICYWLVKPNEGYSKSQLDLNINFSFA